MIELTAAEHDDPDCLALIQRIVNGALAILDVREAFVVHIDNWFDHKWLRWRVGSGADLRIPPFTPNRVCAQSHFSRGDAEWVHQGPGKPLHVSQPGRTWLAVPLSKVSDSGAFIWYSGRTAVNKAGSLMFYLAGTESYAWYASFKKGDGWAIDDECRITRRELLVFEDRGRQLELDEVRASPGPV